MLADWIQELFIRSITCSGSLCSSSLSGAAAAGYTIRRELQEPSDSQTAVAGSLDVLEILE